ncbi:MAG: ATP-binding cassette, subfamily bacterial [Actinomycetota bacterium]
MTKTRGKLRQSLLWQTLGRQRKWVWWALVLFIAQALAILSVTQVTVGMVDHGIDARDRPLDPYLVQIIALAAIGLVTSIANSLVTRRLAYQLEFDVRTRLYDAVQSAQPRRLRSLASGQLITRSITDLHILEQFLRFAPLVIGILPLFIGVGIYMVILNPLLAVVSMGGLPINVWLLRRFRTRLWGLSFAELNERAEVASSIDEPVRGIRVVRAFGREDYERGRVEATALRTYRFAMTRWRLLARFDIPLKFAPAALQGALLLVGARLVRSDSLTLGTFMLAFQVNAYVVLVAGFVDEGASLWQYLRSAQQRLGEVLGFGEDAPAPGLAVPPAAAGLMLGAVSVAFDGRRVLDGLDISVAPGELVVVTGGPSSGKSTLAAVASGALVPDGGVALLEDVPLDDLDAPQLRHALRVAFEEPYLFAATVRENLELGVDGRATESALATALHAAAADDFVAEMDGGIDAAVGDRGLTLSGGQRQRLGLARALVEPARILVLDDALSAVNPSLEVEILRRIRTAYPNIGILCLNRRPGATTIADRHVALPDPVEAPPVLVAPVGDDLMADLAASAADIVANLELSDEAPPVTQADVARDTPPRPREVFRPFRLVAAAAVAVLAVQSLIKFAPEYFLGEVADAVKEPSSFATDWRAAFLVVLGVVGALSAYAFRVLAQRCAQGVMYLMRRRVFERLSRLGIDFYDRELPGQVAARVIFDLDTLQTYLSQTLYMTVISAATVIAGLSVVLALAPGVFPIVLGAMALIVLVMAVQYRISSRAFARQRDALGLVTSTFEEDFVARDAIRGYGAVPRQTARFVVRSTELRGARRWVAFIETSFGDTVQFTSQVLAALVLYRAGNLALAGAISVGTVLTLRAVAQTATTPLSALSRFYTEFLQVRESWRRLQQPFLVPMLLPERTDAQECPRLRGEIEFEGVAFAYPHTGRTVLHDVSWRVPAGTVLSMVGYTGAGKSTISKLLLRTYDPDLGAVRVDGIDLRDLTLDSYRRRVAVVPQDAFLFKGTVASNIAYGNLEATRAQIEAAAVAVCADEVLASLPGGFDCVVDEEARNLTAAQRQLIALARAWLAGPDILVLDEATSCLDARLEQRVLEAVGRLDCTTVMVTHRDNVVAASDLVVVLDEGRVAEVGTPGELRGAGGAYDRLWVQEPEKLTEAEPAEV